MFRTVPLSIIRSSSLYTQQWYMSYSFADSKPVWHIPLLCVHWRTPDDGLRNCPKHVEFYYKNKFEKLVHLVVLIIRIFSLIVIINITFVSNYKQPHKTLLLRKHTWKQQMKSRLKAGITCRLLFYYCTFKNQKEPRQEGTCVSWKQNSTRHYTK